MRSPVEGRHSKKRDHLCKERNKDVGTRYCAHASHIARETYPGGGPQWTNPPDDLDPTTSYLQNLTPDGATNNLSYDFQPMTDIAETMRVTLDREERRDMAFEAQRILLGNHPEHGVEGLGFAPAVMNGISPAIWWPYVQRPDDTLQFAHASHRYDEAWVDTAHPDYPA